MAAVARRLFGVAEPDGDRSTERLDPDRKFVEQARVLELPCPHCLNAISPVAGLENGGSGFEMEPEVALDVG